MRIETTQQTIELGDEITRGDGTIEFVSNGATVTIDITDIYADDGRLFRNKISGVTVSAHITIGKNDSIDNYEDVIDTFIIARK